MIPSSESLSTHRRCSVYSAQAKEESHLGLIHDSHSPSGTGDLKSCSILQTGCKKVMSYETAESRKRVREWWTIRLWISLS